MYLINSREDMVSSSKKLPCGHIFHTACLRSWFQRQQTCPTCRLNILRTPITSSQQQQQPQNQAANNNNNNINNNQNQNLNNARQNGAVNNNENQGAGVVINNPFLNLLAQTAAASNNPMPSTSSNATPSQTTSNTAIINPPIPPFLFPTIPFMAPYSVPPPPVPPNLDRLTDEELRALEGHERKNVEERIKVCIIMNQIKKF